MDMTMILFWAILSFCFCRAESLSQIYIAEDQNCTINGSMTLSPCYSLQQLINSEILLSTWKSTSLLFLPGIHIIAENQTLVASKLAQLEMRPPWRTEKKVQIECQQEADITFEDIYVLNIISIRFTSCTLKYNMTNQIIDIHFLSCTFEKSIYYAIIINNTDGIPSKLTCNITKCLFSFNYGAIYLWNYKNPFVYNLLITETKFSDHNEFGLAICGVYLSLKRAEFVKNSGKYGGTIMSIISSLLLDEVIFHNNHAIKGGAIYLASSKDIHRIVISNCVFINNSAGVSGGAIFTKLSSIIVRNTSFEGNYANTSGGAISSSISTIKCYYSHFKGNSASSGKGGALYFEDSTFIGNSDFIFNKAADGGAIYAYTYGNIETGYFKITGGYAISNSAVDGSGGFAFLRKCVVFILDSGYKITNSKASIGGAIYAVDSEIIISSIVIIANNTARDCGGALSLVDSELVIYKTFNVSFCNNAVTSADGRGGGIFVRNTLCKKSPVSQNSNFQCFFDFIINGTYYMINIRMIFINNSASQGSALYGGLLDRCFIGTTQLLGIEGFKQFTQYADTPLAISSDPIRVCLCSSDMQPECSTRELNLSLMRGQIIDLLGCVVDQNKNQRTSIIRATYAKSSGELDEGEERTKIDKKCTKLSYHIFTQNITTTLFLQPEGSCEHSEFSSLMVHVKIIPCFTGFERSNGRCVCERRLIKYNIAICNITSECIERTGPVWLRYDEQYLKVHTNCPLDYCQVTSKSISLSSPDEQCANDRAGVICGACKENYSIALGSSKCLRCTSNYTPLWLTLVFAVAGVALVAFLLVLNMTISSGTLNGLIFYANVVSISGLTSLQNCSIHPILSVFIAWVNLDLGVETCFYPGMDTYQKTWLQFAFPVYVWLLVAAIIVASHYSSRAMKVFGRNNVAILATLFLLSYTKMLKTIITALTFTEVFQSDALNVSAQILSYRAWMYDGNLDYLQGKHVALFSVALIFFVVLFLPYTLLLIFGQCVHSIPVRRRCVHRIINGTAFVSIMDAYHAPYNDRHHYWTGFMLLTRCVLFLAFATASNDFDVRANMYITLVILIGIMTLKIFATKIYRIYLVSILELSFFLHLAFLSVVVLLLKDGGNKDGTLCSCISVSLSLSVISFAAMIIYHAYLQIRKIRRFNCRKPVVLHKQVAETKVEESTIVVNLEKKLPTTSNVVIHGEHGEQLSVY